MEIILDAAGVAVLVLLIVYVFFWPEKKCPKCETALVQVTDQATNVTKEGCPTCGEYHTL